MIKWLKQNPEITEDDVAAFEKRNKLKLPEDYRKFLLETNGGSPKPFHKVRIDNGHYEKYGEHYYVYFTRFLGIKPQHMRIDDFGYRGEIEWQNKDFRDAGSFIEKRDDIFDHIMVVALMDDGHHCILMRLSGNEKGMVYWGSNEDHYEDVFKLADNFTDFLKLIRYEPYSY